VHTAPTPGRAQVTIDPTENQCDCTAAPSSPVSGSRATIEYVPLRTMAQASHQAILDRVAAIPEGFVRTYGDLSPGAPRLTGTLLRTTTRADLPWWRVVRADGSLAQGERQRKLLFDEGVPFTRSGRVDLRIARIPHDV
jgi:methylated-DNA-protein-cysteine methyltransferase related protein